MWSLRLIAILILTAGFSSSTIASHVRGLTLSYEYLGNETYRFVIQIYSECNDNVTVAYVECGDDLPPLLWTNFLRIFEGDGTIYCNSGGQFGTTIQEFSELSSCETEINTVCVEIRQYYVDVVLPENDTGYRAVYGSSGFDGEVINTGGNCGNNDYIAAIVNIPALPVVNSSPNHRIPSQFDFCTNHDYSILLIEEDPDGDDTVIEQSTPFYGSLVFSPPLCNSYYNIPSTPAAYFTDDTNYSFSPSECSESPNLYVISYTVRELRNGVEISSSTGIVPINVHCCPPPPISSFEVLSTTPVCGLDAVVFSNTSSNASTYFWDFGDGTTSTSSNPTHVYSEAGVYIVTLTSSQGASCNSVSEQSILVYIPMMPQIFHEVLCEDDRQFMLYYNNLDDNVFGLEWSLPEDVSVIGEIGDSIVVSLNSGETYDFAVLGSHIGNCEIEAVFSLNVPDEPVALFDYDYEICTGLEVDFQDLSVFSDSLEWFFQGFDGGVFSNSSSPSHSYPSNGEYSCILISHGVNACPDTIAMSIQVSDSVVAFFANPGPQCTSVNDFSFVSDSYNSDLAQFTWSFENASLEISEGMHVNNVTFFSTGFSNVELLVTDYLCESTYTDSIWLVGNPTALFETDSVLCIGSPLEVVNQSYGGFNVEVFWSIGDDLDFQTFDIEFVPVDTGYVPIQLIFSSTEGCILQDTMSFVPGVYVAPLPELHITDVDARFCSPISSSLNIQFCDSCDWDCTVTINGSRYFMCDFTYQANEAMNYYVDVEIFNEYGCGVSDSFHFYNEGSGIYVPNAVTMNNDGINDFFRAEVHCPVENYKLEIFNRWGERVFQSSDPLDYWVPNYGHLGVFVYKISGIDQFGMTLNLTGHVVVIR